MAFCGERLSNPIPKITMKLSLSPEQHRQLEKLRPKLKDKGLDATPCSPSYLADDVTVGQLIRWVNDEVTKAGKNEDMDMIRAMIRVSNGVETALESYRFAQKVHSENDKSGGAPE